MAKREQYITIGRYTYGPDDELPTEAKGSEQDEPRQATDTDKAEAEQTDTDKAPSRAKSSRKD